MISKYDNTMTEDEEWEFIRCGDSEGPYKDAKWEIFRKEMVIALQLAWDKAEG